MTKIDHTSAGRGRAFVVLTTQRNGSTWLVSVLNRIEGVSAQGELFLPRPRVAERRWDSDFFYPRYVESRARHGSVRPFSVFRYLDAFYAAPGTVGFKLMYSQVKRYPEIVPYLVRKRIPVVHLVRRNHLDVMLSFAIKRQIGKAHILSPGDRPENVRVVIDPGTVVRNLRWLQFKHDAGRKLLASTGLRHMEVAYEELAEGPSRFGDVLRFLGIPLEGDVPESNILKTRLAGQRQVIENYDEVYAALERSPFAGLLERA